MPRDAGSCPGRGGRRSSLLLGLAGVLALAPGARAQWLVGGMTTVLAEDIPGRAAATFGCVPRDPPPEGAARRCTLRIDEGSLGADLEPRGVLLSWDVGGRSARPEAHPFGPWGRAPVRWRITGHGPAGAGERVPLLDLTIRGGRARVAGRPEPFALGRRLMSFPGIGMRFDAGRRRDDRFLSGRPENRPCIALIEAFLADPGRPSRAATSCVHYAHLGAVGVAATPAERLALGQADASWRERARRPGREAPPAPGRPAPD